jgi:hypothetical protein
MNIFSKLWWALQAYFGNFRFEVKPGMYWRIEVSKPYPHGHYRFMSDRPITGYLKNTNAEHCTFATCSGYDAINVAALHTPTTVLLSSIEGFVIGLRFDGQRWRNLSLAGFKTIKLHKKTRLQFQFQTSAKEFEVRAYESDLHTAMLAHLLIMLGRGENSRAMEPVMIIDWETINLQQHKAVCNSKHLASSRIALTNAVTMLLADYQMRSLG